MKERQQPCMSQHSFHSVKAKRKFFGKKGAHFFHLIKLILERRNTCSTVHLINASSNNKRKLYSKPCKYNEMKSDGVVKKVPKSLFKHVLGSAEVAQMQQWRRENYWTTNCYNPELCYKTFLKEMRCTYTHTYIVHNLYLFVTDHQRFLHAFLTTVLAQRKKNLKNQNN